MPCAKYQDPQLKSLVMSDKISPSVRSAGPGIAVPQGFSPPVFPLREIWGFNNCTEDGLKRLSGPQKDLRLSGRYTAYLLQYREEVEDTQQCREIDIVLYLTHGRTWNIIIFYNRALAEDLEPQFHFMDFAKNHEEDTRLQPDYFELQVDNLAAKELHAFSPWWHHLGIGFLLCDKLMITAKLKSGLDGFLRVEIDATCIIDKGPPTTVRDLLMEYWGLGS
jgi:hypothetical protein